MFSKVYAYNKNYKGYYKVVERQRMGTVEQDLIAMLQKDNADLRRAGNKLAEAAIRVGTTYDGIHRMLLAVANWYITLAGEGGRQSRYLTRD